MNRNAASIKTFPGSSDESKKKVNKERLYRLDLSHVFIMIEFIFLHFFWWLSASSRCWFDRTRLLITFFFFLFLFFLSFFFCFLPDLIHRATHTQKKTRTKKNGFRSFFFGPDTNRQTDRRTDGQTHARTGNRETKRQQMRLIYWAVCFHCGAPLDGPSTRHWSILSLSLSLSFYSSFSLDTQRPIWRRNHRAFIGVPSRFVDFIYLFISFLSPFVDSVLYRVFFVFFLPQVSPALPGFLRVYLVLPGFSSLFIEFDRFFSLVPSFTGFSSCWSNCT